jgi:hypothetical protein
MWHAELHLDFLKFRSSQFASLESPPSEIELLHELTKSFNSIAVHIVHTYFHLPENCSKISVFSTSFTEQGEEKTTRVLEALAVNFPELYHTLKFLENYPFLTKYVQQNIVKIDEEIYSFNYWKEKIHVFSITQLKRFMNTFIQQGLVDIGPGDKNYFAKKQVMKTIYEIVNKIVQGDDITTSVWLESIVLDEPYNSFEGRHNLSLDMEDKNLYGELMVKLYGESKGYKRPKDVFKNKVTGELLLFTIWALDKQFCLEVLQGRILTLPDSIIEKETILEKNNGICVF